MFKKKHFITTSVIISLILFNARHVQAEDNTDIEAIENQTASEIIPTNEKKPQQANDINLNKTHHNETILITNNILNDNQAEVFKTLLDDSDEVSEIFKNAIVLHEFSKFDKAIVKYNEIIINQSEKLSESKLNLVILFKEMAQTGVSVEDYLPEYQSIPDNAEKKENFNQKDESGNSETTLKNNSSETKENDESNSEIKKENNETMHNGDIEGNEELLSNPEESEKDSDQVIETEETEKALTEKEAPLENSDENNDYENLDQQDKEPENSEGILINSSIVDEKDIEIKEETVENQLPKRNTFSIERNLSTKSTSLTANELRGAIKNNPSVSGKWNLALDFKRLYPKDSRISRVLTYAAEENLAYAIRQHRAGDFSNALGYYNKILNESSVSSLVRTQASKYKLQAEKGNTLITANDYRVEVYGNSSVSKKWNLAQDFKLLFPKDSRISRVMTHAAEENLAYAIRQHRAGDFSNALGYYNKILNGSSVSSLVRTQASKYKLQAEKGNTLITANDYRVEVYGNSSVSKKWNLAQDFKLLFPKDSRISRVMTHAAEENLTYAIRQHRAGDFSNALGYYNKILNESTVSNSVKNRTRDYKVEAEKGNSLATANDYRVVVKNNPTVSGKWNFALEFKLFFPKDSRIGRVITYAAEENLAYGIKQHRAGRYNQAITYYEKILSENSVSNEVKTKAEIYNTRAKEKKQVKTSNEYYREFNQATYVSKMWQISQEFKSLYPGDNRLKGVLDNAAINNLDYAKREHKKNNYTRAIGYYDRIINEDLINTSLINEAKGLKMQAKESQPMTTSNEYYNRAIRAETVSGRWTNAQRLKKYYPNYNRLSLAINSAAEKNMELAKKYHDNNDFERANIYYERVANEKLVDYTVRERAQSYSYLAINRLNLTNKIIKSSKYNFTLEEMVNKQMKKSPQVSQNGKWVNASRSDVRRYLDPKNSSPKDLQNLTYELTMIEITTSLLNLRSGPGTEYKNIGSVYRGEKYTIIDEINGWYKITVDDVEGWISGSPWYVSRDIDVLQHLKLSESVGIPVIELNRLLENKGMLNGKGSVFAKASQNSQINEFYLIAHALLETGNGTSKLSTGVLVKEVNGKPVEPKVVYNMFGIGAFDKDAVKYGSERAYELGWFTPEAAIIGGAGWVGSQYIHSPVHKQDTLYKMRWNLMNPNHQYATDVAWATKQLSNLSNIVLIAQKYDLILNFEIPVLIK